MKLPPEKMLPIARYAFTRLDGAWFLALADKMGKQAAWDMDVEAWRRFSYILAKHIGQELFPQPVWPQSFMELLEIVDELLGIEDRTLEIDGDDLVIRTTNCEMQRMIAKAGVGDCGIATKESMAGFVRGLMGKDQTAHVRHTQNLNQGDPCCEVIVSLTPPDEMA